TAALNNERTQVDIQGRRLAASVQLIRALGGGWDTSQLPNNDALAVRDDSVGPVMKRTAGGNAAAGAGGTK
ncbi:MAG: RND transporter, partial [Betaproteobacteria bacterium]